MEELGRVRPILTTTDGGMFWWRRWWHRQLPALERMRERDAPSITKLVARHLIQAVGSESVTGCKIVEKSSREANRTFCPIELLK